jgi:hypothetical protein
MAHLHIHHDQPGSFADEQQRALIVSGLITLTREGQVQWQWNGLTQTYETSIGGERVHLDTGGIPELLLLANHPSNCESIPLGQRSDELARLVRAQSREAYNHTTRLAEAITAACNQL